MATVPGSVPNPMDSAALIREQIAVETKASGGTMTASETREIMASQALLDARQMPSIILEGEMGTGKTHSMLTLFKPESGIRQVFMLTNEAGWEDVLGHIPPDRLAVKFIPVSEGNFAGLALMVKMINTMHPDVIQQGGGINRHLYPQFEHLLGACNNFVDDRTGKSYGPVFNFPQDTCLWYESISALSEIAKNNAIGDKPFMELRDYQMVQNPVRKFLNHLVFGTKCLFVATAHLERETNESTQSTELMVSTVGRKLGPILPRFFSDVIVTDRIPGMQNQPPKFIWQTERPGIRTKTRNLPWSGELKPDFVPLLDTFRKRMTDRKAAEEKRKAADAAKEGVK